MQNVHAAVIKNKKTKCMEMWKSHHAAVMFSNINCLNLKTNILSASKDVDPHKEIEYWQKNHHMFKVKYIQNICFAEAQFFDI